MGKIKIIDRDFSVLEKTNPSESMVKSFVAYEEKDYLTLSVEDNKGGILNVYIHLTNVPDQYIIDMLALHGFYIELIDTQKINTFDEFKKFLTDNELVYDPSSSMMFSNLTNFYTRSGLEKEYNVKFNLEV